MGILGINPPKSSKYLEGSTSWLIVTSRKGPFLYEDPFPPPPTPTIFGYVPELSIYRYKFYIIRFFYFEFLCFSASIIKLVHHFSRFKNYIWITFLIHQAVSDFSLSPVERIIISCYEENHQPFSKMKVERHKVYLTLVSSMILN